MTALLFPCRPQFYITNLPNVTSYSPSTEATFVISNVVMMMMMVMMMMQEWE
jgi:hypothetical protein